MSPSDGHALSRERRLAYCRCAARYSRPLDWEGNPVFRELPILELEYARLPTEPFLWDRVDWGLKKIRERTDCQDFIMIALFRMLYRYQGSALLTAEHRAAITHALLGAKYWNTEPGPDTCCWTTENHQAMYHVGELLAGQLWPDERFRNDGRLGRAHREHARERLYRWLDWRMRLGFSEWNSAHYYDDDIAVLLNLYDYAEDAALRGQAARVLDQMFFELAVIHFRGTLPVTQGRAYDAEVRYPSQTPVSILIRLVLLDTPVEELPARLSRSAVVWCGSGYEVPQSIRDIAADLAPAVCRHRHSANAEDAHRYGIFPDRVSDYGFFAGSGQGDNHLCVESGYILANGEGHQYAYEYYARCKAEGLPFDPDPHYIALSEANLYIHKTPDTILSCAQDFRPGKPGFQQHVWTAGLGDDCVVFSTNPATGTPWGRPGLWHGNGIIPRVLQEKNVLLAFHRVRDYPIYDQPPWYHDAYVHAYFPQALFDEVREAGPWVFGRCGRGFIALGSLMPWRWNAERLERERPCELIVDGLDAVFACETGAGSPADFDRFVRAVAAAEFAGGLDGMVYGSPSLGRVAAGWHAPLVVGNLPMQTGAYPRFDNPWARVPFGENPDVATLCRTVRRREAGA